MQMERHYEPDLCCCRVKLQGGHFPVSIPRLLVEPEITPLAIRTLLSCQFTTDKRTYNPSLPTNPPLLRMQTSDTAGILPWEAYTGERNGQVDNGSTIGGAECATNRD